MCPHKLSIDTEPLFLTLLPQMLYPQMPFVEKSPPEPLGKYFLIFALNPLRPCYLDIHINFDLPAHSQHFQTRPQMMTK